MSRLICNLGVRLRPCLELFDVGLMGRFYYVGVANEKIAM